MMSRKKPLDKTQARERRNRMLDAAAASELSLTDGVREMRAIAGMTQEEFALHRGVSARVIKALELNKGNPTIATLNRIGQFFGLEVAFVPIKRTQIATGQPQAVIEMGSPGQSSAFSLSEAQEKLRADVKKLATLFADAHDLLYQPDVVRKLAALTTESVEPSENTEEQVRANKTKKPRTL